MITNSDTILIIRAKFFAQIRQFFTDRNILEVDTPHLSYAVDPNPFVPYFKLATTDLSQKSNYLQTSPELYMKRLLCAGSGDIYQLSHVFRNDYIGRLHAQEFMMLEWYRLGFNIQDLITEVFELIQIFIPNCPKQILSYCEVFKKYLAIDNVFNTSADSLKNIYQITKNQTIAGKMSKTDWLDLLMVDVIEPQLSGAVFIHSYPEEQASLAKIIGNTAQRFELYLNGVEIANGFDELQDVDEQRRRFEADNNKRQKMGLATVPLDEEFLLGLENGLPQCSGVAVGIDRLLMTILGKKNLTEVLAF